MIIDLAELEILDVCPATSGTEFVRAAIRETPPVRYVIHRLGATVRGDAAALHRNRLLIEKYQLRCMMRYVGSVGSNTAPAILYEDFQFRRLASRRSADTKTLLTQAIRIVEALHEAHSAGLVLNCVQPTSFVLTDDHAKILDFGQATPLQVEYRDLRSPWQIEGDLRYIAPEQTGRLNRGVDYRADYYSLGIILYEMFVGATPFSSADPLDLVYEHLTRMPESAHERENSVPPFVSDIIQKLLSKDPARRYQSAEGILADLMLAVDAPANIPPDPRKLGHVDVPYNLHISTRLYGRVKERTELISAYKRACEGSREVVFLSGYSGIGKTSLIRETYIPITRQRSYFVSGKFEQLERRIPYSAWLEALNNLLTTVLTEPEQKLAELRHLSESALGPDAGVLTEVLPALTTLIGAHRPPPPLPARESEERFVKTFCGFLSAFCSPGRPLAVFLDDLQWADAASLNLLERVASDPISRYVFLIVSARDNELSPTHPFSLAFERIKALAPIKTTNISLSALSRGDLTQLVADTFRLPSSEAAPLSGILAAKSGGNPFFAWQFLRLLRAKGLVRFSTERMRWIWNADEINALGHSDNVVELMLMRLHQLPQQTQYALSWAACLGAHFDLSRLALVMKSDPSTGNESNTSANEVYSALEPALIEELIVSAGPVVTMLGAVASGKLRFSHDRVQEAAYKLLDAQQIASTHLRIARLFLHDANEQQISENIFDIANHLNAASSLIDSGDDRIEHARINLQAARRAAKSGAFSDALAYSTSAMKLLPPDIWDVEPSLARSLWCARGEYEYLNSRFHPAEHFVREAIAFETDVHAKADLHHMLVVQYTLRAAYPDAIAAARAGLELLRVKLPDENLVEMRDAELRKVDELLAGRSLKTLGNLPIMTDRTQLVVMKLLIAMGPPCYRSHPRLWSLIVAYELRLCLEHGVAPGATYTFPAFGGLRQYLGQGSAAECRDLHESTRAILPSVTGPVEASVGHLMMGSSLDHWFAPLSYSSRDYQAAFTIGVESGNLQYAAYALAHDAYCKFYQGVPLQKLIEEVEGYRDFCSKRKNMWGMDITEGVLRIAHTLASDDPNTNFALGDEPESAYLIRCEEHGNIQVLGIYYTLAAAALLHMGRLEAAAEALKNASPHFDCFATQGLLPSTQYQFLHALLLLAIPSCFDMTPEQALSKAKTIAAHAQRWAADCPDNYQHIATLLETEIAIATGADISSIIDGFDKALESATEQKTFQRAGLIASRAAAWWKKRGKSHYAAMYEAKARAAYQAWQAGGSLGSAYGFSIRTVRPPSIDNVAISDGDSSYPTVPRSSPGQEIDIQSIVRTAQAVAKSTELAEVVQAVIDNVQKASGAQRTVLLLPHDQGIMHVWQSRKSGLGPVEGVAFDDVTDIPRTIIQYVMRTLTTLRVHGNDESTLARDPYIQATRPASIICVPILLSNQMQGILYLEHREIFGAFDESRLQLVEFLAAAAAAAVRNANLVRELRADITLRMAAEAKWKQAEREQRLLVEQSPLGVQVFSADGKLVQTNRAFAHMWGTRMSPPTSLRNHPLLARHPAALQQIVEGEVIDLGDHCLQESTGRVTAQRWVKGRAYGVKDPSGALERIVLKLEDITERKRIEELKSEFVSTVSHELRTPITSIRGALGLLMGGAIEELSIEVKELLAIALANSERLTRLVDDILDFEKIEHGTMILHMQRLHLFDTLHRTAERNRGFAIKHEVELVLDAPDELQTVHIQADPDRLEQIITNLISNAVKFSPPNSRVTIRAILQHPTVRIEVRDAGEGVPVAFRSRLFQRFSQADSSDTRRHSGTGLGLSITRELAGRMGGSVGYEPIEPIGSCFFVEFNIA